MSPDRKARFFRGLASFKINCFAVGTFVGSNICGRSFLGTRPTIRRAGFLQRIQFRGPVMIGVSNGGGLKIILVPRS